MSKDVKKIVEDVVEKMGDKTYREVVVDAVEQGFTIFDDEGNRIGNPEVLTTNGTYFDDLQAVPCRYYAETSEGDRVPLCIVGQVLDQMGLLNEIKPEENTATSMRVGYSLGLPAIDNAYLTKLQNIQDSRTDMTWAEVKAYVDSGNPVRMWEN
jgi:hypothetical protein